MLLDAIVNCNACSSNWRFAHAGWSTMHDHFSICFLEASKWSHLEVEVPAKPVYVATTAIKIVWGHWYNFTGFSSTILSYPKDRCCRVIVPDFVSGLSHLSATTIISLQKYNTLVKTIFSCSPIQRTSRISSDKYFTNVFQFTTALVGSRRPSKLSSCQRFSITVYNQKKNLEDKQT